METLTHNENDLLLRLVEVWYDVTWAYYMSSSVDHVAKRIDKHRKTVSSTASVVSVATTTTTRTEGSMAGKSMKEKILALETHLRDIKAVMKARQFEDICRVSMKSNDDLYPGFKDILLIAKYLLQQSEQYSGLLTPQEINGLTLTQVFQYIYYQLCEYLLSNGMGREALKLVITPAKITHATYDICRQKFCRLLCDETSIVQYGLFQLIKVVRRDREHDSEGGTEGDSSTEIEPPQISSSSADPSATPVPEENSADVVKKTELLPNETSAVVAEENSGKTSADFAEENLPKETVSAPSEVPLPPSPSKTASVPVAVAASEAEADEKTVHTSFSTASTRNPGFAAVPFAHSSALRAKGALKFPVIDLSSDDDEDEESSVSSLGSD